MSGKHKVCEDFMTCLKRLKIDVCGVERLQEFGVNIQIENGKTNRRFQVHYRIDFPEMTKVLCYW